MKKNNGSVFGWLIPVGVIIALIAIFGKLPSLAVTEEAKQKAADMNMDPADAAILSQARKELTGLRVLNARIREPEIRNASNEICGIMENVLAAL